MYLYFSRILLLLHVILVLLLAVNFVGVKLLIYVAKYIGASSMCNA